MAVELVFLDESNDSCISVKYKAHDFITGKIHIKLRGTSTNAVNTINLDISTAIEFAEALRIEINKMSEREVGNG